MKRSRLAPAPLASPPVMRFRSAEDAWFWFVRCHRLRREGARLERSALSFGRPCEPDDIFRWVRALERDRRIRREHLVTLERFGAEGRPPDPRIPAEADDVRRWDEAMDRLLTVLRARGALEEDAR